MNYNIYKVSYFIINQILLVLLTYLFLANNINANTKKKSEQLYENKFNEAILKEVLKGAGFSSKDALLATKAFNIAYPLERLTNSSYLILPFADENFHSFAVSIDGLEAVLIIKSKNNFKIFVTSTDYAHEFIEKGSQNELDNEKLLEIENNLNDYFTKNVNFIKENIIFEKGDTLLDHLYIRGSKRKDINNAIQSFTNHYNPGKIKIKTKGKILRTNEGKILGFYLVLTSSKTLITYLTYTGYETIKSSASEAEDFLKKKIKPYLKNRKLINTTKISLLNDPLLKKIKTEIKKGNNLFNFLKKQGISNKQIGNLILSLNNIYDPKRIRPGQNITLAFKENNFFGISIEISELQEIQIIKTNLGFKEYVFERPVKKIFLFDKIDVQNSLYVDSLNAGVPQEILIDMIRLFSYSIDFQRDIKKNNSFTIFYEYLQNYNGKNLMPGDIVYAKAKLNKDNIEMFKYKTDSTDHKYFNIAGESIRKTLMKTPIDGARLSSRFGRRIHPILGYSKMHKGVDFAAKKGTPVYAAGDGVIERANNYGGYGNYIRIRHNSEYKTAYAHLHRFAKKIKRGLTVKQGQVIGYVGSTGRSTGPHLHYEILLNNRQINPQKLKLPEGKKLNAEEMKKFNKIKEYILEKITEYTK